MGRLSARVREKIIDDRETANQPQDIMQDIVRNETKGTLGIIEDIKKSPVPSGYCEEVIIGGPPIDFHDLETFVVSISPTKFVNLLKLQRQTITDFGNRYSGQKKPVNFKFLFIFVIAIILMVLGVLVMLYMPQLMQIFQMGV